jgi:hypothetical protein
VKPSQVIISFVAVVMCIGLMVGCGPLNDGSANPTATATQPPAPTPTAPGDSEAPEGIPAIGDHAPDFTLPSVWGEAFTLSNYRGDQNVVLLFYRTGS